jgi:NADH dehydrogenase
VKLLLEQGRRVRAMTRDPATAEDLTALGAEVVRGDLRDADSLRPACDGAQCVIASAHAALGRGANAPKTVDRQGHRDLIDAAAAAGVARFVYVSAHGLSDVPLDFFQIKYEMEEYLKSSGLPYTIVRGTAFMETWLQMSLPMFVKKGKILVLGPGTKPVNFVSAGDVARVVVMALGRGDSVGRTLEIGGPENLSVVDLARILGRVSGKPVRRTHVPLAVIRIADWVVGPFHRGIRLVLQATLWGETVDRTYDPSETLREFPMELTRFEDVTRRALAS